MKQFINSQIFRGSTYTVDSGLERTKIESAQQNAICNSTPFRGAGMRKLELF